MKHDRVRQLLESRRRLIDGMALPPVVSKGEEEGGCGVVGFCCSVPVAGRHIYEPSKQMHNRGNGKGGGIAAVGLIPEQLGVSREVLDDCYMLHVALIDPKVRSDVEMQFIDPHFDVVKSTQLEHVDDWKSVPGLEAPPPEVVRYFVRVKPTILDAFIENNDWEGMDRRDAEDEFINQNSFRLNQAYYASLGDKRAFVMSHGRDIMILKVVGFAEAIVQYYKIEDLCAHIWIAHQRYPTKGRVWHPGGAHPFAGVNMALVHNGDFANYHSVTECLRQRHIVPQFLTDTEVSALLFDLLHRTYEYPLEYIIEALAPTSELDFDRLPEDKQKIYRTIQATHIHSSPDGPWFFIIARNVIRHKQLQLMGITDTAMLRPQVFALLDGEVQVGLIASEKQAIDATLLSMSKDDPRISPIADCYWNARGGSHTDGGTFIFNLEKDSTGGMQIQCADKFGKPVRMPSGTTGCDLSIDWMSKSPDSKLESRILEILDGQPSAEVFAFFREHAGQWTFEQFAAACRALSDCARDPNRISAAIEALTLLNDRTYPTGDKKKSHLACIVRTALYRLFRAVPYLGAELRDASVYRRVDFQTRSELRSPDLGETTLIIDSSGFAPEGRECDAALLVDAYAKGWQRFICFDCRGQRFTGCGLGPDTDDVIIDVYGSSGDYLASGIDGLTITVHGNAQDQLGQIIKRGKLVIHGDVGQTFMYGAKGGEVFVRGNAAGRPLINSVGRPRVVINGTCLDFLAESFMAGDPLQGGGFVVLNGIRFDDDGQFLPLSEPYPGSNLFSLASGGAIYVRDPRRSMVAQQLNGGEFDELTEQDWELILPFLQENERLFGIRIEDLLVVNGQRRTPQEVYRKVRPVKKTTTPAASAKAVVKEPEPEPEEVMVDD